MLDLWVPCALRVPSLQGQVLLQEVRGGALGDALSEDGGVKNRAVAKRRGYSKRKNAKKETGKNVFFSFFTGTKMFFLLSFSLSLSSSFLAYLPLPPPTGACIVKSYSIVGITEEMNLRKSTR